MVKEFAYQSREQIRKGDWVLFHGQPGEIEFVVREAVGDPAVDWYMTEFGGGVMVAEPKVMGHAFLNGSDIGDELVFVARGIDESQDTKASVE